MGSRHVGGMVGAMGQAILIGLIGQLGWLGVASAAPDSVPMVGRTRDALNI